MKKFSVLKGLLLSGLVFGVANAQTDTNDDGFVEGTFQVIIHTNPRNFAISQALPFDAESMTNTKTISLMRFNPTPAIIARAERIARLADEKFSDDEKKELVKEIISFSESESAKDLTMNGVPVHDQGKHGTCVTFATTAALDAVLEQGDLIDQECTLAHSLFLGNDYWNGARRSSQIIDPLKKYGIVDHASCPIQYPNPDHKLNTEEYKNLANKEISLEHVKYKYHDTIDIDDVKTAIDNGRRVAIGFMLKANSDPISVQGFDIKINGKVRKGGLWDCKISGSSKNYCGFGFAGHEVVVIGYDDTQELLKIRNSWGEKVADEGDYYMSYDFFNAMSINGTEVWSD